VAAHSTVLATTFPPSAEGRAMPVQASESFSDIRKSPKERKININLFITHYIKTRRQIKQSMDHNTEQMKIFNSRHYIYKEK
jgi:hypothetical protein